MTLLKFSLAICTLSFVMLTSSFSQEAGKGAGEALNATKSADSRRGETGIRLMFYNVENLFDVVNDSLTADDEYTPEGMRRWTYARLQRKINNISKVIIRVGGWEPPEVVGLCEVENRYVLSQLVNDSPLKNIGYKIIHKDSPDPRGIDVALLYRPLKFKPVYSEFITVKYPFEPSSRTRDILYVKGLVLGKDTVHIFVNHWPSRFGGQMATIPKRNYVAQLLRTRVDSIHSINPAAKVVIMGDLNDEATDESVAEVLGAKRDSVNLKQMDLYNMMSGAGGNWNRGTIKDKEVWIIIDQFIVSASMLESTGFHTTPHWVHIMDAPFLLQKDESWFGQKPFRTYFGAKYTGGFSDHLPIYMDLKIKD
ncbi:MAG: endonuclease [Bacteroidales bacterium]|nr:endonuclease [Bacteroidales bacterium]